MPNFTVCQDSGTVICAKCRGLGRVGRSGEELCSDCESSGVTDRPNCCSEPKPDPEVQATSVWAKDQPQSTFVSSAEDKADFPGYVNLFNHLSSEVLQKLTPRVHLVALPAGHVIKENELTDGLYIIKSAITQVTKPTGSCDPVSYTHLTLPTNREV